MRPRDSKSAAKDADAMPLPKEDTTPPVTNTNLVMPEWVLNTQGGGKRDYKGLLHCDQGKSKFVTKLLVLKIKMTAINATSTDEFMGELSGKHIVLGLSGGIAAYKAAELCRAMVKEGATVQVVMTEAAEHFMTKVTMQALSGRQVFGSQWDDTPVSVNGEGIANNMPHINLTRGADAIVIAPCSADFMAKLLHGCADELLSLMCLARPVAEVPLILAPAIDRKSVV